MTENVIPRYKVPVPQLHSDATTTIPMEIQEIPQWITWQWGDIHPKTGKRKKIPIGKDGTGFCWQEARQWLDFGEALRRARSADGLGIGLVLPARGKDGQHLVALDYDKVGLKKAEAEAAALLRREEINKHFELFGRPYMELTPSGDGVRMLVTSAHSIAQIGSSPNPLGGADELFCGSAKWITVTGIKISGSGTPDATTATATVASEWKKRLEEAAASKRTHKGADADIDLDSQAELLGWESLGVAPTGEGGRNTTLCSLLGRAYANGHTPTTVRPTVDDWNSKCQPPMDDSEVEATVNSMWKTHTRNHPDAHLADMRRDAQRKENTLIGAGEQFTPQPEVLTVREMLNRFIFLSDGSRVFDIVYPKHVLPMGDFRNLLIASYTITNTGTFGSDGKPKSQRIPNTQTWLESRQRLSVFGTTFDASAGMYVKDPLGKHCVNMWAGFDRRVDPTGGDISRVLTHIRWLFSDRSDDFLDWLAHIEQYPGVLPHTMWLHVSSKTGTGRNAIATLLSRLFAGYAAMSLALERMLDSTFNDELSSKVLAVVDEIRIRGQDQWRHTETLKQMITAQVRHINVKYGRKSVEANACRFLVFSNHRNAIPMDDTDRRIEVVICDDLPKGASYYAGLYGDVSDQIVVAAFAKFLRERDITSFNPGRHALKSSDKQQIVASTSSDEYSALKEFTEKYTPPLATSQRLKTAAGLFDTFSGDARRFGHIVLDAGWQKIGRRNVGGRRHVIYSKATVASVWIKKSSGFEMGLPVSDGGKVEWHEE